MTDPKLVALRNHLNAMPYATEAHPNVLYNLLCIMRILEENGIIEPTSTMNAMAMWTYVELAIKLGETLPAELDPE